ncbi:MAG: hypothetical protein L3K17_09635 [Thermoplasmata archaeon]|nr:hypothetical protein [Thermoplasmata archaeon]
MATNPAPVNHRMTRAQRIEWIVVILVAVACLLAVWSLVVSGGSGTPDRTVSDVDVTPALGPVFHPGIILGAGSNATDTLLAGVGVYTIDPEFTLPVLADLREGPAGPTVENLTALVNPYFYEGGTYALGWNGSGWLVGGQATWGGNNDGTLVALHGAQVTNFTALIYPYFAGGGIFALGWNGTSWLLGGNSSTGIALVAVQGTHVTNLTRLVPDRDPLGWFQLIVWNGNEWMLGGEQILGTLSGTVYHDLLPSSPFGETGVYSGAWNGSAWLVGGGGGRAVLVRDDQVLPGLGLPNAFDQAVLLIINYSGGWIIGGKGSTDTGGTVAELVTWTGESGTAGLSDYSSQVPSTFRGGEIQGGGWAPELGARDVLLVGEGSYDQDTGFGVGAMALLSLP